MRILIISDTHRRDDIFFRVMEKERPVNMLIHAGDVEGSEDFYEAMGECEFHCVAGNNDFFSMLPMEEEFYIGTNKVFLTHGHQYRISVNEDLILDEAKSRGANILIYGHTHRPVADWRGGILVMNPGSLTYPRQEGRRPSYIILEVAKSGNMRPFIKYL